MNAHSIWSSSLSSMFSNSSSFPFILINSLRKETSLLVLLNVFLFACSSIKASKIVSGGTKRVVWRGCINAEQLNSLEILHRRAARVIYKLPKDLPSSDVYQHTNWDTIDYMYKLRLIKLLYKIVSEESPPTLSYLVNRPFTNYNLRNCNRITVPRFNSYFLKN